VLRAWLEPVYANPALLDEDTVTRYHQMLLASGVRGALIQLKVCPPCARS